MRARRFVGGEGALEVSDGFDLRRPEIRLGHLIGGQKIGESGVEVGVRFAVFQKSFGPVKCEGVATLR
jgi:hypothetical protein